MSTKVSNIDGKARTEGIRARHRADVMKLVLDHPGIDRTRLAEATGLTNAAMTRIVQELIAASVLNNAGQVDLKSGRGRKRSGLEINRDGGVVLGLSVLAFNSSVVLCDLTGHIKESIQFDPGDISNPVSTLDEVSAAALGLLEKHQLQPDRVFGVGVAIAGYLDGDGETLDSSPYLGWPVFNIRKSLAERLNLNVVVDNVNRCIAVAENRKGSCRGVDEFILIRAAMGIGGAVISNGEVVRGNNNRAGQIGHSCVQPDGRRCPCGATGCLNTIASGWAILNQLGLAKSADAEVHESESQEARLRNVLSPKHGDDARYQSVISHAGELLAEHCIGLLHSVVPHSVVLTGPLGRNEAYCEGFRRTLDQYNIDVRIIAAHEHKICGSAQAASVLALTRHVYSPAFDIQPLLENAARVESGFSSGIVL